MKCKICECDLSGKAYFKSYMPVEWSKNGSIERGPFCTSCVRTPLGQLEILENRNYAKSSGDGAS